MRLSERVAAAARGWSGLDLVTQYALAAALVIGLGMGAFGWWVASRIERGVIEQAAANTAMHLDSFVEPLLQDLARGPELGNEAKLSLSGLIGRSRNGKSISGVCIWGRDGGLVFATVTSACAQSAQSKDAVRQALGDKVTDHLDMAGYDASGGPVLRLYAPMHDIAKGDLIAVAELHERAVPLMEDLKAARLETAGVLALLSVLMVGTLLGIVRKGGHTIEEQRTALTDRVSQLSTLLAENEDLRKRVQEANLRSTETNDRFLRRVSAELHDGPVQLIALALLRLEGVVRPVPLAEPHGRNEQDSDYDAIESALRDALKEIRGMSSGLSLPKLEGVSVAQAIDYAVRNHERRSRTRVEVAMAGDIPREGGALFLTCLYRFIQEGLNNAFRHAKGQGQAVRALMENGDFVVEVKDSGPGFLERLPPSDTKGLGLIGLSDRVETLGGKFEIVSSPGEGTCLRARFGKNALQNCIF